MAAHDHEVVSIYGFDEAQIDELLAYSLECVLMWSTQDGWPVGVIHSFVWHEGRIWLTFTAQRHRAAAIRRDNRVSVNVSSVSARDKRCPNGSVTIKGHAKFHDDEQTKTWFYRALSDKVSPNSQAGADSFYELLDSPLRVILEIEPVKWITFDAGKSARDRAGKLSEDEKTPRLSSDTVRMEQERNRRGLPPR